MYYKKLIFIITFSLLSFLPKIYCQIYQPKVDYIESFAIYNGDNQGGFKDNFTIILTDGSTWKIHPDDQKKISQWNIHDIVQVWVRTSFYWFKRAHKFELHNISLDDSVKVMLVRYPDYPLRIVETETRISDIDIIIISHVDAEGNIFYIQQFIDVYEKKLYLSDGTVWTLSSRNISDNIFFNSYNQGDFVYIGSRCSDQGFKFFIVTDIGRKSKWVWAKNQIEDD